MKTCHEHFNSYMTFPQRRYSFDLHFEKCARWQSADMWHFKLLADKTIAYSLDRLKCHIWLHFKQFLEVPLLASYLPYAHHHKPLLIRSRSWIQAIHKDRIFWKNLLKNKEMVFGNGVKNIQAVAYNGARTVLKIVGFQVIKPETPIVQCI